MKVSFVITTYNRFVELVETLHNLENLKDIDKEVIVVDNNSQDDTKLIPQLFPNVNYIRLDYNSGEWGGRCIAMQHSTGELICSLDDDSFPDSLSIKKAIKHFKSEKDLGIISMEIFDYDTHYKKLKLVKYPPTEVLAFIACGGIFRRELLYKVGTWENWISGGVEHSFSLRVRNAGYKIKRFYDIYVFHHLTPKSRKETGGLQLQNHSENIYKIYETYYGFWKAIPQCFNILQRGILVDLTTKCYLYTKGFINFCKYGRSKRYKVNKSIINSVRIPFRSEGYKSNSNSDKFTPSTDIKHILLLRTRSVQLMEKYVKSIRHMFPKSRIDLLTHNTNTIIPNLFTRILTYPHKDQFEYKYLKPMLKTLRNDGIIYDLVLFCAEDFKVIGGYENIQNIAKCMKVPIGSVGLNNNIMKYSKYDYIKVKLYTIVSKIIALFIFIKYFIRFKKRTDYYFDIYTPLI